jgi:uncharacterized protein
MLNKELLDILACPRCKGDVQYREQDREIVCSSCCLAYPVKEDIPVMLIEEARDMHIGHGENRD